MTASNTEEIILQAIERLIERDNPSLETMKMQVHLIVILLRLLPVKFTPNKYFVANESNRWITMHLS